MVAQDGYGPVGAVVGQDLGWNVLIHWKVRESDQFSFLIMTCNKTGSKPRGLFGLYGHHIVFTSCLVSDVLSPLYTHTATTQ